MQLLSLCRERNKGKGESEKEGEIRFEAKRNRNRANELTSLRVPMCTCVSTPVG